MQENHDFNLEHDYVKFCVSWYSIQVSQVGMKKFVAAWNEHRIQGISTKINAQCLCITVTKSYKLYHHFFCTGRGIPNVLMAQNNQTKPIDNSVVPAADEAGRQYEENGGTVQ